MFYRSDLGGSASRGITRRFVLLFALFNVATVAVRADAIALYSAVFNGYTRTRQSDDTFKPETYALADAGRMDISNADDSINALNFKRVALTLAKQLEMQGYVPSAKKDDINLLIMVAWGTTRGSGDFSTSNTSERAMTAAQAIPPGTPSYRAQGAAITDGSIARDEYESSLDILQMYNTQRDRTDDRNAQILGYSHDLWRADSLPRTSMSRDIFEELSQNRYFVVLKAFDFQHLRKTKKFKILWETRYSIVERGNAFDKQLAAMTRYASQFFGQDSNGLLRRTLPNVKVDIGEATVVPESAESAEKR
jgi:hypothetical protein